MATVFVPLLMITKGSSRYIELSKYGVNRIQWALQLSGLLKKGEVKLLGNELSINNFSEEEPLKAGKIKGLDIRATAALLIFALGARGTSVLYGVEHLTRAYGQLLQKLETIGAGIYIAKNPSLSDVLKEVKMNRDKISLVSKLAIEKA